MEKLIGLIGVTHTKLGERMEGQIIRVEDQNVFIQIENTIYKFNIDEVVLCLKTKRGSKKAEAIIEMGYSYDYTGKEGRNWVVYLTRGA